MTGRKNFGLQILSIIIIPLVVFGMGTAQTREERIRQMYFDNIVRLTTEALSDSCINISLCEVSQDPYLHEEFRLISDSGGVHRYTISPSLGLRQVKIIDNLRASVDMDTLIILSDTYFILREGTYWQFPSVNLNPCSEWIMFLDSPFLMSRRYHTRELDQMKEYENKLKDQIVLNSRNYFTLYEQDAGALCTYFPEDAKYPPMFIYSDGLVDDFRTIIKLQEDRSLLTETAESYENHYSSLKEELSRRVFSALFEDLNQE